MSMTAIEYRIKTYTALASQRCIVYMRSGLEYVLYTFDTLHSTPLQCSVYRVQSLRDLCANQSLSAVVLCARAAAGSAAKAVQKD